MFMDETAGALAFHIVGVMQDHDRAGGDDPQCVEMPGRDPNVLQCAGSEE
jgi:hypothetical protein